MSHKMKQIFLLFFLSLSVLAQTNDSLGVVWTDPVDADLDSIRLYYWTGSGDTVWFVSIDEGIEIFEGVSPIDGLLRIFAKAKDDSSNLSVFSAPDTTTIWQTGGGGTNYITGNLRFFWYEDSLATGQVGERYTAGAWHDSIVDSTLGANTTYAPFKDADSGVVWYTTDYLRMYPVPADLWTGSGISFEILVNLTSLTSPNEQVIMAAQRTTPDYQIFQIGVEQGDSIFVYHYDGGSEYAVETNGNPALNNYLHIVGTTNNSGDLHLYFNGVERTDNTGTPAFNFLSSSYFYVGGESTSYNLAVGSAVRFIRVYDDVLTSGEVSQNYTWWTEQ